MSGEQTNFGKGFSHDRSENTKHEWLTPPELVKSLGEFDLDPCAPVPEIRPWDTAKQHLDINDDGLSQKWTGRVWLNPPYENEIAGKFLAKMVEHGNGVVLIYARTETENFFRYVWGGADAILFIKGRLRFWEIQCANCGLGSSLHVKGFRCLDYRPSKAGVKGGTAGAPSVLIGYGKRNVEAIMQCGVEGQFIKLRP